jgi:hypothetical protein
MSKIKIEDTGDVKVRDINELIEQITQKRDDFDHIAMNVYTDSPDNVQVGFYNDVTSEDNPIKMAIWNITGLTDEERKKLFSIADEVELVKR